MRVTRQTQGRRRGPTTIIVDDHQPRFRVNRPQGLDPSIEFQLFHRDGRRCVWCTVEMSLAEARGTLAILLEFVGSFTSERARRKAAERRADELQRQLDALTETPAAAEPQAVPA